MCNIWQTLTLFKHGFVKNIGLEKINIKLLQLHDKITHTLNACDYPVDL